jgi:hypothetical protein
LFDNWSGAIVQKKLPGMMMIRLRKSKNRPCSMLYSGPTVLSNGVITACGCRDLNGDSEHVIGHVKTDTLLSVWNDGRWTG